MSDRHAQILGTLTTEGTENTELKTKRNRFIKKKSRIPLSFLRELCVLRGEYSGLLFLFFRIGERLFENGQHRLHVRPFDLAVEVEIVDSRGAAVLRPYVVFRNIDAQ